jgi:hypothetical protein
MPAPTGQSFAIVSGDPSLAGSLEFAQYAGLVSSKMTALGYQAAPSAEAASLVVSLDYGVDKGKEKMRLAPGAYDPWYGGGYGGWGYGRGGFYGHPRHYGGYGWGYGWNDPWFYGGMRDEVESYTVYTSGINLTIENKAESKRVFEGKAEALSLTNNLTYLVPNLVEAMFTGFPGNSGETVKITVAQPKKK